MTRQILRLSTLALLTLSVFAVNADAGCNSRGCGYKKSYHRVRYAAPVRHVQYVQPVVQQVVAPPVVAAPIQPEYPTVPAGATITLPANFLGDQPGSVFMVFNDIKLPVQVQGWKQTGVTITLPPMAIKDSVVIRLDIILPHGELAHKQILRVTKPASVIVHPTTPTPQLPTQAALAVSGQ